jgi:hypothetical protein
MRALGSAVVLATTQSSYEALLKEVHACADAIDLMRLLRECAFFPMKLGVVYAAAYGRVTGQLPVPSRLLRAGRDMREIKAFVGHSFLKADEHLIDSS